MHTNYDKFFNINTSNRGKRAEQSARYFQYEATPYPILYELFSKYKLKPTDHFVDIGCGKGRLLFYVHYKFSCTVTGIEMNEHLYQISQQNKQNYIKTYKDAKRQITITNNYAEHFKIKRDYNVFYMFNPFSLNILEKVLQSIQQSVQDHPRIVDLVFYYPSKKYINYLDERTPFEKVTRIEIPKLSRVNKRECFLIYRLN